MKRFMVISEASVSSGSRVFETTEEAVAHAEEKLRVSVMNQKSNSSVYFIAELKDVVHFESAPIKVTQFDAWKKSD